MIATRIAKFHDELARVSATCDRDPRTVAVLGVTKGRSINEIQELLATGIETIGENRVQEAAEKLPQLPPCRRVFIGHLQRNKVRDAVQLFDRIASVDSIRLAEEIAREASIQHKKMEIFVQANLTREAQKSGFLAEELDDAVATIRALPTLRLTGLMLIGPQTDDEALISHVFREGKIWHERLKLDHYSAGMSHDWQLALRAGATELRIGSQFFR